MISNYTTRVLHDGADRALFGRALPGTALGVALPLPEHFAVGDEQATGEVLFKRAGDDELAPFAPAPVFDKLRAFAPRHARPELEASDVDVLREYAPAIVGRYRLDALPKRSPIAQLCAGSRVLEALLDELTASLCLPVDAAVAEVAGVVPAASGWTPETIGELARAALARPSWFAPGEAAKIAREQHAARLAREAREDDARRRVAEEAKRVHEVTGESENVIVVRERTRGMSGESTRLRFLSRAWFPFPVPPSKQPKIIPHGVAEIMPADFVIRGKRAELPKVENIVPKTAARMGGPYEFVIEARRGTFDTGPVTEMLDETTPTGRFALEQAREAMCEMASRALDTNEDAAAWGDLLGNVIFRGWAVRPDLVIPELVAARNEVNSDVRTFMRTMLESEEKALEWASTFILGGPQVLCGPGELLSSNPPPKSFLERVMSVVTIDPFKAPLFELVASKDQVTSAEIDAHLRGLALVEGGPMTPQEHQRVHKLLDRAGWVKRNIPNGQGGKARAFVRKEPRP